MKTFINTVLLGLALVALPLDAARKDDAFTVDRKSFKKVYKTIALSPIDSDPVLQMPDAVAVMVEDEITQYLEKKGFTVIPSTVLGDIRKKMEEQVGGVTNPETGGIYIERLQAVRDHGFRELWFQHQLDAVATIRVSASRVRFEKDRVEWDGVRQRVQKKGGGSFSGNIFVSSVAVAMFDDTDALLYSHRGGLEVLMRREKDQLVPIEAANYFQDEKLIRKATKLALDPI